jgi:thiol peroxidase
MATITFKGTPVHTAGNLPAIGKPAPAFALTGGDLGTFQLADAKGKWVVLNIFPSLDTPVCALSVKRFNTEAVQRPNVLVLCISADLPFAQGRFCAAEGLKNVKTLSVFRTPAFGKEYGLIIADSPLAGLLARAVVVIDPAGVVKYAELVPEIAQEPNYAAALKALA